MLFERSIFTVSLLATAAFVAAGIHAYVAPPTVDADLGIHILLSLGAVLLLVFPHLWTLIYLWSTGRAVRREVEARHASPRVISRSRRLRRRALPPLVLASLAALATLLLGQEALVGTRPWLHPVAFFTALALQLWALWAERSALAANAALLDELDERARRAPADDAAAAT